MSAEPAGAVAQADKASEQSSAAVAAVIIERSIFFPSVRVCAVSMDAS
jgi:hypothetical protein